MRRLETKFEIEGIKKIRMNCQCGYGIDKKLALVKELMTSTASIKIGDPVCLIKITLHNSIWK